MHVPQHGSEVVAYHTRTRTSAHLSGPEKAPATSFYIKPCAVHEESAEVKASNASHYVRQEHIQSPFGPRKDEACIGSLDLERHGTEVACLTTGCDTRGAYELHCRSRCQLVLVIGQGWLDLLGARWIEAIQSLLKRGCLVQSGDICDNDAAACYGATVLPWLMSICVPAGL